MLRLRSIIRPARARSEDIGGYAPIVMPELRLGRWQEALADIKGAHSLICDPPYSQRTAAGYRSHGMIHNGRTAGVPYGFITAADSAELAGFWSLRIERWVIIFADHISWRWHEESWAAHGWMTFAPVQYLKLGAPPRFRGDGPASQCDYVLVARRRGLEPDGSRPGYYVGQTQRAGHGHLGITGQKDLVPMRKIIRDYSRPGDLVIDPYCGAGTTALACALEGRCCITAEINERNHEIAKKRLEEIP